MIKYQVILKSGKNADKLYSTIAKAIKANSGNILKVKEIELMDLSDSADGKNTARGKQFSSRKNKNYSR
jgi:hypothetical protein|tara:strand:+ start:258 stop:464 length:207 start_codon:yes stop_codon:yes gene_type:complete